MNGIYIKMDELNNNSKNNLVGNYTPDLNGTDLGIISVWATLGHVGLGLELII